MKFKLILILLIITMSCGSRKKINLNKDLFEVVKITKKNELYILEIKRNDSIFTVISVHDTNIKNGISNAILIKKGDKRSFHLERKFPPNNFISYVEMGNFRIGNNNIKLNKKNHWSVYIDTTLSGRYIPQ